MQRYTPRDILVLVLVAVLFAYSFGTSSRFGGSIEGFLLSIGALVLAVTFHEFSHAFIALRLGDWTAQRMGRVSLNPLRHLDLFGSLSFLFVGFGWGKPVPINPYNMRMSPAVGAAISALAGPASNVLFAALVALPFHVGLSIDRGSLEFAFLSALFSVNILLAAFNFLPIPPLDGFSLARLILPPNISAWLEQYGMFVLLALVFLPSLLGREFDVLGRLMNPLASFLSVLVGGGTPLVRGRLF